MKKDDFVVSYSQNREDLILAGFFRGTIKPGFYVDIGANHPSQDSVTKYFYDLGWRGINIEPNANLFKKLVKKRPRDKNLNIGIGSQSGHLSLRSYKNHGLSTFSQNLKETYEKSEDKNTIDFEDIKTPVMKLSDVLQNECDEEIWFMKIDVEGFEYEVLESNDWAKFRPWVLCIESNHMTRDWLPILQKANYKKVFFDGLNEYYVATEQKGIAKSFSYPESILIGKPIIDWRANNLLENYLKQIKGYRDELVQKKAIIEAIDSEKQSLRWAILHVFHTIKDRFTGENK